MAEKSGVGMRREVGDCHLVRLEPDGDRRSQAPAPATTALDRGAGSRGGIVGTKQDEVSTFTG